jgi:rhodanese-related sulfurtransferase
LAAVEIEVSPERAAELAGAGEVRLVDVRRDDEWRERRIAGAHHVPLDQLANRAGELDDGPVVFYCRTGDRSLMAAEAFVGAGREAASVAGGIVAWESGGQPVET